MASVSNLDIVVLDTNVLIHDPHAVRRFSNQDVYLPLVVLEQLDAAKKGVSELARSAREASHFISALLADHATPGSDGVPLTPGDKRRGARLHFVLDRPAAALPSGLDPHDPGTQLLGCALVLQRDRPDTRVTLVSKDVNLRIKAQLLGIAAEDYLEERRIDDSALGQSGVHRFHTGAEALEHLGRTGDGRRLFRVARPPELACAPNEYVELLAGQDAVGGEPLCCMVHSVEAASLVVREAVDHTLPEQAVWGVHARSAEQNAALNLLLDPEIDLVTLAGQAGTGKTLLTLAAGLHQTLEARRYQEILVTRVTVPVGEDIGFLPGTEEEKMHPWMGALEDNLEILLPESSASTGSWGRAATHDLVRQRVRIKSLNFMRGRTFIEKFLIIDEAQNLTPHQLKTLITRAGRGTKIVCLGNLAQIDTPYITAATSGLSYVVDRFRSWPHAGHVALARVERSRLADHAAEVLDV